MPGIGVSDVTVVHLVTATLCRAELAVVVFLGKQRVV